MEEPSMYSISISMLRAPLARVLATTALACVAGITTQGAGPAAHAARPTARTSTLALGQGICIPCLRFKAASPPELLATHYDWDGYREVDVFGRNFTPNRWMQFVITDRVTGEQVATALGWSGASG